jgi:hypothetical protein
MAKVMTTWLGLESVDCLNALFEDMAVVGTTVVAVEEIVIVTRMIEFTLVFFEPLFLRLLRVYFLIWILGRVGRSCIISCGSMARHRADGWLLNFLRRFPWMLLLLSKRNEVDEIYMKGHTYKYVN